MKSWIFTLIFSIFLSGSVQAEEQVPSARTQIPPAPAVSVSKSEKSSELRKSSASATSQESQVPKLPQSPLRKKIRIGIFDAGPKHPHEKALRDVFKMELGGCAKCELRSFPLYDREGTLRTKRFLQAIADARAQAIEIYHLSWNIPRSPETAEIESELKKLVASGAIVVAAAGIDHREKFKLHKLNETVMGSIAGIYIIGELNPNGVLDTKSSYGPEMFTALRPPTGLKGSSFSSAIFTSRLAKALASGRDPTTLYRHLVDKRNRSGILYPSPADLGLER